MNEISTLGIIIGFTIAIFIIVKKGNPFYALIFGALIGALIGGASLSNSILYGIEGAKSMIPAVLRVLAAGVLAGVLIETGSAKTIAYAILKVFKPKWAILAIIFAAFFVTSIGVFIDVTVITIAPIALQAAQKIQFSNVSILVALIGGGKAGNIISPNPNTIAAAEFFSIDIVALMLNGIIPALAGILVTFIIAISLKNKHFIILETTNYQDSQNLPSIYKAMIAPLVVIFLLLLKPLCNIKLDPIIVLPLGGFVGVLFMNKLKHFNSFIQAGFSKLSSVALLLLGTGFLAGIISHSQLQNAVINALNYFQVSALYLAPLAGIIMSGVTASTTSGTAVGCSVFGNTIVNEGYTKLATASMIHHGATTLDHLPHGSFFHATAGSINFSISQRLKIVPYETLIGLIMTIISVLVNGF
jgi:gluconate:H+ symporter, GntP family